MQSNVLQSVIAMLVMLGSLVLFHELGHYLVGRLCGVAIEKFAIGFGHRIAAFRRGQTDYLIGWIPLGGYVKFYGSTRNEDVPEGVKGLLYWNAPVWKRVLIVAAGPIANFVFAFVIFWGLVMHGLEHPPANVGDVIEGGRAQLAGILPGDRFIKVDGQTVKGWGDIERIFQRKADIAIPVTIERKGEILEKIVTPEAVMGRSILGSISKIGRVGVALAFPSAVVTILQPDSVLASDGVKTGDRIESWSDESGAIHEIHGLHETFSLFAEWSRIGRNDVKVQLQPISIKDDKDGRPIESTTGEARQVVLHISKWPKIKSESDRAYASKLGASDSHLTIGIARGPSAALLKSGDRLLQWEGENLKNVFHLQEIMGEWKKPEVNLKVLREFTELNLKVALKPIEVQLPEGAVTIYILDSSMLGQAVMPDPVVRQEKNPYKAAIVAIEEAYTQTAMMANGLWQIVTGAAPAKALGGPVMLAKVASDSAKAGLLAFLATMAVVSINLGLVNLFPIPVLDGGQLVLLGAEGIKRSPISETTIENFQKLGFVIVMSLVVLALYNDLSRYWSSMVGSIVGPK